MNSGGENARLSDEIIQEIDDFDGDFSIRRQEDSFP